VAFIEVLEGAAPRVQPRPCRQIAQAGQIRDSAFDEPWLQGHRLVMDLIQPGKALEVTRYPRVPCETCAALLLGELVVGADTSSNAIDLYPE
jgi:hypothetical protein